jgi:hypothetical protein
LYFLRKIARIILELFSKKNNKNKNFFLEENYEKMRVAGIFDYRGSSGPFLRRSPWGGSRGLSRRFFRRGGSTGIP